MKFLSLAVAAAAVTTAFAKSSINLKDAGSRKLSAAQTHALLRNAIPVDRHGKARKVQAKARKVQEEDGNENGNQNGNGNQNNANGNQNGNANGNGFQIAAYHSIQFGQCLSLSTEPENYDTMFGDDTIALTTNGLLVSQSSYVLFTVCETTDCSYYSDENTYMIDLASFMGAMSYAWVNMQEQYCQACQNAYEYCLNLTNGTYSNSGRRDRMLGGKVVQEVVDCYTCGKNGCFDNMNNGNNNNGNNGNNNGNNGNNNNGGNSEIENVAKWVDNLMQCVDTGKQYNNMELYAGFICNGEGTGAEIGLFLDNKCSVYTSKQSYKYLVAGTEDYDYLLASQQVVTYPFLNDVSCAKKEFISPDNANDNADANDDGDYEVSESCKELFNYNPLSLSDCGGYVAQENQENQDEAQGDDKAAQYGSTYQYQVSQNDLANSGAVCLVVQAFEGEYSVAHVYNGAENDGTSTGSGTAYDYSQHTSKNKISAGKTFGIIMTIVVVIAGTVLALQTARKKKRDGKKAPLVKRSANGSMA